jgi:hypothetical protein
MEVALPNANPLRAADVLPIPVVCEGSAHRKIQCVGTPTLTQREEANRTPTMSCRIDRVVTADDLVVLLVSGRITGEYVDMLRDVLQQETSGDLTIDLKNVLLVDREAIGLLALSEDTGTELRNCPPYVREWVTRERTEKHKGPESQGSSEEKEIEDV